MNNSDPSGMSASGADVAAAVSLAVNIQTPQDFAVALLFWMNLSVCNSNVQGLLDWESSENTAFPDAVNNYTAAILGSFGYHNPLDTGFLNFTSGMNEPVTTGASRPNGQATAYPTWLMGVEATANTLTEPQYFAIYNVLNYSEGALALDDTVLATPSYGTQQWSTNPLPPYVMNNPNSASTNCSSSLL